MNRRQSDGVLILVTALSALFAVLLAYGYLEKRLAEARVETVGAPAVKVQEAPPQRAVVVMQRDVFRGERLQPEDLTVLKVPLAAALVKGVIQDPAQALDRAALQTLYAGEWLLDRKLAADTQTAGTRALIEPGYRAIRVSANAITGLLGLLQPGDHIDLVGVFAGGGGQQPVGRTLIQNVPVLAVGQRRQPAAENEEGGESGGAVPVTLRVTPEQAEVIALAERMGTLRMVLRHPADTEQPTSRGVSASVLERLGRESGQPAAPPRHTIEILHGERLQREVVTR